jgi:hypothetical protein
MIAPPALAAGIVGDPLEEQEAAMAQIAVRTRSAQPSTGTACLLRKMSGRLFKSVAVGFTRAQQLKRRCLLGERRLASLSEFFKQPVPPCRTLVRESIECR